MTYRRDSPEVAKLWLRLVFMQLTRDLFAIAKFLFYIYAATTVDRLGRELKRVQTAPAEG